MKKLFGAHIKPNCAYCENSSSENGISFCKKSRHIENNKCRKFRYNPLMRVPLHTTFKSKYNEDDFRI